MKRFVSVTAWLIHNNYQSESMVGECCRHLPYIEPAAKFTPNPIQGRWWTLGFVKMTENNYVIKEDPSKHETFNQCWADIGSASQTLGQQQPSIGLMSRVCRDGFVSSGHSFREGPQQRRDIKYVLVQCWPIVSNAGPTLKQHKGNVTCLLGSAHDANRSVTIQLDEGGQTSLCVTVEPLLYGHHYCKPKMAVQDKWPLIGGHVFSKKKYQRFDNGGRIRHQECQFLLVVVSRLSQMRP